jgi:hypothetical protein
MWHRVDVVLTDVSEEGIASIFRVEGKIRKSASEEILAERCVRHFVIRSDRVLIVKSDR